jgi:hypothetical protein
MIQMSRTLAVFLSIPALRGCGVRTMRLLRVVVISVILAEFSGGLYFDVEVLFEFFAILEDFGVGGDEDAAMLGGEFDVW